MRTNGHRVPTRFGPETRFEITPTPAAPFRVVLETELELLKNRLLSQQLARVSRPQVNSRLRRAANEAAALAWTTAFPLLVFPALFEEKARGELLQAQRQDCVRERSRDLLVA